MNNPKLLSILALFIGTLVISLTYSDNIIESRNISLESFLVINFLGYLFFLIMPVEALFLYYLTGGYNVMTLIFAATLTGLFGQIVDYLVGKLVNEKYAKEIVGKNKYKKIKNVIHKYGKPIMFVFSLSILSSPIVAFIAGVVKCDWKQIFLYSFLGLLTKYMLIAGFYMIF